MARTAPQSVHLPGTGKMDHSEHLRTQEQRFRNAYDVVADPVQAISVRRVWRGFVQFMGYLALAMLVAGTIMLVWATGFTWAHEAKPTASQRLGWTYDYGCCSSIDCYEMADGEVEEVANTFVIRRTGEVIPADDPRIKRSKDEFYHQCTPAGNRDAKRSICLYVPDRGI